MRATPSCMPQATSAPRTSRRWHVRLHGGPAPVRRFLPDSCAGQGARSVRTTRLRLQQRRCRKANHGYFRDHGGGMEPQHPNQSYRRLLRMRYEISLPGGGAKHGSARIASVFCPVAAYHPTG